jgi:hypothetical protein
VAVCWNSQISARDAARDRVPRETRAGMRRHDMTILYRILRHERIRGGTRAELFASRTTAHEEIRVATAGGDLPPTDGEVG